MVYYRYLPNRQLRKVLQLAIGARLCYLPNRQLRKVRLDSPASGRRYLPNRQLRKLAKLKN